MAADHIFATVTLPHMSGLARDEVVNGFSFKSDVDGTLADLTAIHDRLQAFYGTAASGTGRSLGSYISPCIKRTASPIVRYYDVSAHLSGLPHGSPITTDGLAALDPAGSTDPLPSEVACVLSFNSAYSSDAEFAPGARPRSRDRGRVFIGPLNMDAHQVDGTFNIAKPHATFRDTLLQLANKLHDDALTNHVPWCTWSRKNARMEFVLAGWVDDAFDTVRNRGERPTLKTTMDFTV
jgi:hypothetical protein